MREKRKEGSNEILRKRANVLMKLRGYRRVGEEEREEGVTDITVLERRTGKKLLMRLVTKSKLSSGDIGVRRVRSMQRELKKGDVDGILIGKRFTYSARREARRKHIELVSDRSFPPFNIFKHELVPKHEILPKEEAEKLLKRYRIKPYQMPLIRTSDPAARVIGAKPGDILKITRKSPTAGKYVSYRYVV